MLISVSIDHVKPGLNEEDSADRRRKGYSATGQCITAVVAIWPPNTITVIDFGEILSPSLLHSPPKMTV